MSNFIIGRSFSVCSYQALENVGWINLAQKLKDFPAATAIFKDSQGVSKPCISAFTAINYNNTVKPMTHC